MKLLQILLVFFVVHFAGSSSIFNSIKEGVIDGVNKVKDFVTDDDSDEKKLKTNENIPDYDNNDDNWMVNRTEDYCSFTKLEKKIEELPDPEVCKKINKRFEGSNNFDFINNFGELFNLLREEISKLKFPKTGEKLDTIFFVGNTGSGKSTTVQILGGDNSKIFSKRQGDFSSNFIITDNSKIGTDTITSETLYPDLLIDNVTGYVLCDNPGFEDTRSTAHEIIAVHGMRKVLEHIGKIKIVIVSNQASLQVGGYRDDFPKLLKHVTNFFHDIDKYKKSIFLIDTKAENTFRTERGIPKIVSDSEKVGGTAYFLEEVKNSLKSNAHTYNLTVNNKDAFIKNSIKIIDALLEKNNGAHSRINILRRPAEEGPLSENELIQEERNKIRQMLLSEENMVQVKEGDFGFPLTDTAVIDLNEIFEKMNDYVIQLSKIIAEYITNHYTNLINANTDINDSIEFIHKMKGNIKQLSYEIGAAENPGKYANLISNFSLKNKLNLECLTTFQNISTLNGYLTHLEDLTETTKYTPLSWNISMKPMIEFIENKSEDFKLLTDVFKITSTYKYQKERRSNPWSQEYIDMNNFKEFLKSVDLKSRYELINIDETLLVNVRTILNIALHHETNVTCTDGVLIFIDYFILLNELQRDSFDNCDGVNKIVILALHTIFIDSDSTNNWFKGKDVTIIAPTWDVVGTRTISVDGESGGNKLPNKANLGQIGKFGMNGKAGGKFAGIGQQFNYDYNLKITACGGDGQDGQDGGDGEDGGSGNDAIDNNLYTTDVKTKTYVILNYREETSVSEGSSGLSGGDAGEGGGGGYGGRKGSAFVHNIGKEKHEIKIVVEDGKLGRKGKDGIPGKGGIKGCDKKVKKTTTKFFFIPVGTNTDTEYVNCNRMNPEGTVRRSNAVQKYDNSTSSNNDSPVCVHIMKFQDYYIKEYHPLLSDGITKSFINAMKATKY